MQLPWNESEKSMRKKERKELLEVMQAHQPGEPAYEKAFEKYRVLYELEQTDRKVHTHIGTTVLNGIISLGTVTAVLTSEYWTPLASNATRWLPKPFSPHNDSHLLM